MPQTVSPSRLQEANALLGLTRSSTQVLGTAAGGILVAAIGSGWALAFDAATYFLGAVFLLGLRLAPNLTMPDQDLLRELRERWDSFRARAWLWGIVVQFAFVNAAYVGAWAVLGPVVAEDELGGAATWGHPRRRCSRDDRRRTRYRESLHRSTCIDMIDACR